jgi:Ni/Fe-hydrogenase 1 B-type cytochrome subunit
MSQEYRVWDGPTRWFHWITVLVVFALGLSGFTFHFRHELGLVDPASGLALVEIHSSIGYALAFALIFRFVWAFVGNRHARWSSFWPTRASIRAVPAELRALRERRPIDHVGHSPLSRLATSLLLSMLLMSALTGLFRAGSDLYAVPLGPWFAAYVAEAGVDPSTLVAGSKQGVDPEKYQRLRDLKGSVGKLHFWLACGLIAVIGLHIAGVSLTEIRQRSGLVSAMFSGRKFLSVAPVDFEPSSHPDAGSRGERGDP